MLFWGEASLNNVLAIKSMLRSCELVLGLKVIFHNRFFVTLGAENEDLKVMQII